MGRDGKGSEEQISSRVVGGVHVMISRLSGCIGLRGEGEREGGEGREVDGGRREYVDRVE